MKKKKLDVVCMKCGRVRKTHKIDEMPKGTHHLEMNFCLTCEGSGDDFCDVYYCDSEGNYIYPHKKVS